MEPSAASVKCPKSKAHFEGTESLNFVSTVYALFMGESWSESPLALNGRNQEMDGAFVYFTYFNFIASKRGSV